MLALIGPLGTPELIVIVVLGLLIFGKRLPEVGKSLGRGIVEFKKGLTGIEEEVKNAGKPESSGSTSSSASTSASSKTLEDKATTSAELKDRDTTA